MTQTTTAPATRLVDAACGSATHDGPHLLAWASRVGGTDRHVWEAVETALSHVTEADGEQADGVPAEHIAYVHELIANARALTAAQTEGAPLVATCLVLHDAELAVVRKVLVDACEYMDTNDYAADGDFPEDQMAATLLGYNAGSALACFAPVA